MTKPDKSENGINKLKQVLETGTDDDLSEVSDALFAAAEADPSFANIAADWLQYGRYGVLKDEARAAYYRSKAVEALIPDAVYDHALILEGKDDDGTKAALPFYILSAILGNEDAISGLSEYFLYGNEFETDYFIAGALKKHENLLRRRNEIT